MSVVQLEDLVECLFSDFADALAESPLVKSLFLHRALLNALHVVQDD